MIPRRRMDIRAGDFTKWLSSALAPDPKKARADVAAFEEAFRRYLGCAFARATCSGRDALELALEAVGARPGDEIIIPAYTLGELLPILQAKGYKLVPADIEPDTLNLDVASVTRHIGPRTRVILALHLHGAPCDIRALCDLAERRGLHVVEDCAHALGASVDGCKVGTFGDAAFFSLESNKALPTYGGGVVVLRDPQEARAVTAALAQRKLPDWPALKRAVSYWKEEAVVRSPAYGPLARVLLSPRLAPLFERAYRRSHGRLRKKTAYSGFQARLGLARLPQVDGRNNRLNRLWEDLAQRLPQGLVAQKRDRIGRPAFYNFVALSERIEPAELRRILFRKGVDIGIRGEVMDDCGRLLGVQDCPVAADVFHKAVILPLYEGLSHRRLDRVVSSLREVIPRAKA